MYSPKHQKMKQLSLDDFYFPYGELDPNNRWIEIFDMIPWEAVESAYASLFTDNGAPALDVRIALGSLILKAYLGCSDRELVNQITENPYFQFVLGVKEYSQKPLFAPSTLVDFRKRLGMDGFDLIAEVNQMIIPKLKAPRKPKIPGTGLL